MNIAQGLKEKNKIITKLNKLYARLSNNNSVMIDTVRSYNPETILEEILKEEDRLIKLKTSIHRASELVRASIFTQSELKNRIKHLRGLNTNNGKVRDPYGRNETPLEYTAIFGAVWVDETVEKLEKEIEAIQETLDTFNHNTLI